MVDHTVCLFVSSCGKLDTLGLNINTQICCMEGLDCSVPPITTGPSKFNLFLFFICMCCMSQICNGLYKTPRFIISHEYVKEQLYSFSFIFANHFENRLQACCKYVQDLCKLLRDDGHSWWVHKHGRSVFIMNELQAASCWLSKRERKAHTGSVRRWALCSYRTLDWTMRRCNCLVCD